VPVAPLKLIDANRQFGHHALASTSPAVDIDPGDVVDGGANHPGIL